MQKMQNVAIDMMQDSIKVKNNESRLHWTDAIDKNVDF